MTLRPVAATENPTPHPARGQALVRDWRRRFGAGRRALLLASLLGLALCLGGATRGVPGGLAGALVLLATATGLGLLLSPLSEFVSLHLGAVDWPDRRHHPARPTPRLGGAALWLAALVPLLARGGGDAPLAAVAASSGAVLAAGMARDLAPLPRRVTLAVQAVAALVAVQAGLRFPAGGADPLVASALAFAWILVITTAFRELERLEGLGAAAGLISGLGLALLALVRRGPDAALPAAALAAATAGFLLYAHARRGPPTLFLGRGGATALGFLLATLSLGWAGSSPTSGSEAAALLLLFALPLHAALRRVARRLDIVGGAPGRHEGGGAPSYGSGSEALLRSKSRAVGFLALMHLALVGSAFLVGTVPTPRDRILLLVQALALVAATEMLERRGRRRDRRGVTER